MNHEQTTLPITEDHSTIYLSVEVSRSSWVIGVYCPATDENIRTHKIKAAETQELYALAPEIEVVVLDPARVRSHLIQMAWCWLHHQPESKLSLWYRERTKDGQGRNRKKLIIAMARKPLVALWQFATRSVIPEGSIVQ